MEKIRELLERTHSLVQQGWVQGRSWTDDNKVCLLGGVLTAAAEEHVIEHREAAPTVAINKTLFETAYALFQALPVEWSAPTMDFINYCRAANHESRCRCSECSKQGILHQPAWLQEKNLCGHCTQKIVGTIVNYNDTNGRKQEDVLDVVVKATKDVINTESMAHVEGVLSGSSA